MRLYFGNGMGAAQATSPAQLSVAQMIVNSANQYGVPPQLALGIASHESGFNPSALNPNGGAAGVMQLMPGTSQTMGVANPMDAQQNIDGGVRLLSQLLTKYNGDETLALWAYSNGPGSVTAGGANPANMPAQAAGLVSYVEGYQPPSSLSIDTSTASVPNLNLTPVDTSSTDTTSTDVPVTDFSVTPDNTGMLIAAGVAGLIAIMALSR